MHHAEAIKADIRVACQPRGPQPAQRDGTFAGLVAAVRTLAAIMCLHACSNPFCPVVFSCTGRLAVSWMFHLNLSSAQIQQHSCSMRITKAPWRELRLLPHGVSLGSWEGGRIFRHRLGGPFWARFLGVVLAECSSGCISSVSSRPVSPVLELSSQPVALKRGLHQVCRSTFPGAAVQILKCQLAGARATRQHQQPGSDQTGRWVQTWVWNLENARLLHDSHF